MSLYVNNKQYTSNIIIDRGLSNVNITDNDIRPGKVSIDAKGNKLNSLSSSEFLSKYTSDATATAEDITDGKILYNNGVQIVGTAKPVTNKSDLINGTVISYVIAANNTITTGDFVSIVSNTVYKYDGTYDIHGVAVQDGITGTTINVVVPN